MTSILIPLYPKKVRTGLVPDPESGLQMYVATEDMSIDEAAMEACHAANRDIVEKFYMVQHIESRNQQERSMRRPEKAIEPLHPRFPVAPVPKQW